MSLFKCKKIGVGYECSTNCESVSCDEPICINPGDGYIHLSSPVKSPADKKEYSVIRLKNGLTALLISDVSSEKEGVTLGACALSINVGSFSDPPEIGGMAHFLEHMVFMGSKKYPAENEFDLFLKPRGGNFNAMTQNEETTYYFSCQEEHMHQALDIFSQFFISPLLKRDSLARERQAIDAEFSAGLGSDAHRIHQIRTQMASDGNPFKKFLCGNLETLKGNNSDDDVYNALHAFRKRHYSAHRMTLAIQASMPQHVLAAWVLEKFSQIENNKLEPDVKPSDEYFPAQVFNKMYFVESVDDYIDVELTWELPPQKHLYKQKPLGYLSRILAYEGKGGLISWLRKKVWAHSVTFGGIYNTLFSLIIIKIKLTEEGYKNLCQCLEALFSFIKYHRDIGPVERLFMETKRLAEMKFQFMDDSESSRNVFSLAQHMQILQPQDYITGAKLFFEFDPESIKRLLTLITPERVNIIVARKQFSDDIILDQYEKLYKTRYTFKDIPITWLHSWKKGEINEFYLSKPNVFIPDDLSLLSVSGDHATVKHPRLAKKTDTFELWFKQDIEFKRPLVYMNFNLISSEHDKGSLQTVLTHFYMNSILLLLKEDTYQAKMANMNFSIVPSKWGLDLMISGFNQNIHQLLNKIVHGILTFKDNFTEDQFNAMKKLQQSTYIKNQLTLSTLSQELKSLILQETHWPLTEYLKLITQISYTDILEFSVKFYDSMYFQCLVQGNITQEKACDLAEDFAGKIIKKPLKQFVDRRVYKLPTRQTNIRVKSYNSEENDINVDFFFQNGPANIKELCVSNILRTMMKEPLFYTLRTQEQLGYTVTCSDGEVNGILSFIISVTSRADKFTADYVEERIDAFLCKFEEQMRNMSVEQFNETKTAVIKLKQKRYADLSQEFNFNWREILKREYVFDRREQEVAHLNNIEQHEVLAYMTKLLGPQRKLLVTQIVRNEDSTKTPDYTTLKLIIPSYTDKIFITDISSFKQTLILHKLHKNIK